MSVILITGGLGFIGRALTTRLKEDGHIVYTLDRVGYPTFRMDVRACGHLAEELHIDQIYHLACDADPERYVKDQLGTLETCIDGAQAVIGLARRKNAKVLFASTSEIYGELPYNWMPITEDQPGMVRLETGRACYDEGKRVAEVLFRLSDIESRTARIFNTYGPDMNDDRVVPAFIKALATDSTVKIHGTGNQTRSFCYIDDTIEGLIRLMDSDYRGPVNIGNPEMVSILELMRRIAQLLGKNPHTTSVPKRAGDPDYRQPSIRLAKRVLDWEPTVDLDTGLRRCLEGIH